MFNKSIQINPQDASAYNNCGIALNDQNKYNEAISMYKQAIKINPLSDLYRNNLYNSIDNLIRIKNSHISNLNS